MHTASIPVDRPCASTSTSTANNVFPQLLLGDEHQSTTNALLDSIISQQQQLDESHEATTTINNSQQACDEMSIAAGLRSEHDLDDDGPEEGGLNGEEAAQTIAAIMNGFLNSNNFPPGASQPLDGAACEEGEEDVDWDKDDSSQFPHPVHQGISNGGSNQQRQYESLCQEVEVLKSGILLLNHQMKRLMSAFNVPNCVCVACRLQRKKLREEKNRALLQQRQQRERDKQEQPPSLVPQTSGLLIPSIKCPQIPQRQAHGSTTAKTAAMKCEAALPTSSINRNHQIPSTAGIPPPGRMGPATTSYGMLEAMKNNTTASTRGQHSASALAALQLDRPRRRGRPPNQYRAELDAMRRQLNGGGLGAQLLPPRPRGRRSKYCHSSIEKRAVAAYAQKYGPAAAAKRFGIPASVAAYYQRSMRLIIGGGGEGGPTLAELTQAAGLNLAQCSSPSANGHMGQGSGSGGMPSPGLLAQDGLGSSTSLLLSAIAMSSMANADTLASTSSNNNSSPGLLASQLLSKGIEAFRHGEVNKFDEMLIAEQQGSGDHLLPTSGNGIINHEHNGEDDGGERGDGSPHASSDSGTPRPAAALNVVHHSGSPGFLRGRGRGRPKLIGDELDHQLVEYMVRVQMKHTSPRQRLTAPQALHLARRFILERSPGLLEENGGNVRLRLTWAMKLVARVMEREREMRLAAAASVVGVPTPSSNGGEMSDASRSAAGNMADDQLIAIAAQLAMGAEPEVMQENSGSGQSPGASNNQGQQSNGEIGLQFKNILDTMKSEAMEVQIEEGAMPPVDNASQGGANENHAMAEE